MEEFKRKIEIRRLSLCLIFILLLGMGVFFSKLKGFEFVFMGVIAAALFVLIHIINFTRILKDEKKMKKFYIQENDERKQMIESEAMKSTFQIGFIILSLVTAMTIDYNQMIGKVLIYIMLGCLFLLEVFKFYYSRKY